MEKVKKLRPILQMENTECGAASLAMVLEYYGKYVPLEEMRIQCGVSRNGVNAKAIAKAAMYNGLKVRALKMPLEKLNEVKTPAIIHWNMDHFLVLLGFTKKGAKLADPAEGLRTVTMEELSRSFTGIVLEFTPTENFEKSKDKKKQSHVYNCTKRISPELWTFIVSELCLVLGLSVGMFVNSVFIDRILGGGNTKNLSTLMGILLVSGIISVISLAAAQKLKSVFSRHLNLYINTGFITKLLKLPIEFFSQRNSGELSGRQSANMQLGARLAMFLHTMPMLFIRLLVYSVLLLGFDVKIAVIAIASALINTAFILYTSKRQKDLSLSYMRDMGSYEASISQTIDMIETIKSTGGERASFIRLSAKGTKALNSKMEIERLSILTDGMFTFLNSIGSAAVLIAGVGEILGGNLSVGLLCAMSAIADAMLEPLELAALMSGELQNMASEAARTDDIMNYKEDEKFADTNLGNIDKGEVELSNLSFSYNPTEGEFMKDFNLKIRPGEIVAVTGRSGSGKSTAARIIAGILTETGGEVKIDNHVRKSFDRYYYYAKVASVSQNVRLFDATVFENISMWDNAISYERVVEAAKAACIHEDIILRKNGYYEKVLEGGKNFSGGQRQRIEIARALVKKPAVLILDEATSALDADTEERIMNNIKAMGMTVISIAHRLSSVKNADRVIVIDNGNIAEEGTHEELMELGGIYTELQKGW